MISPSDRKAAVVLINEAVASGARKTIACKELSIDIRTFQRWTRDSDVAVDRRPDAQRPVPANSLSASEKENIIKVSTSEEFCDLPPSQIVPILVDRKEYIGSESSIYRVLKKYKMLKHRGRSKEPRSSREATTHCATAPNQVWCWDITYLPGPIKGQFYYFYMILDLFSRKIVGQEVHTCESSENAARLVHRTVLREGCIGKPLILHSDNGSPMKGATLRAKLKTLEISSSFSRPRVSNDNAFAESLFRTFKYRPEYPSDGFSDLDQAREWVLDFTLWYNLVHRHSSINFVTPDQRHRGEDIEILKQRALFYQGQKEKYPERWSGPCKNMEHKKYVYLNPEKAAPEDLGLVAA